MFTIDKRPFENASHQARAEADAVQIESGLHGIRFTRGQQLVKEKTITEQLFEQRSQAFRNAQASVTGMRRRCARPNSICEFTELRAPINGRIGDRRVSPGNW